MFLFYLNIISEKKDFPPTAAHEDQEMSQMTSLWNKKRSSWTERSNFIYIERVFI